MRRRTLKRLRAIVPDSELEFQIESNKFVSRAIESIASAMRLDYTSMPICKKRTAKLRQIVSLERYSKRLRYYANKLKKRLENMP